MLMVLCYGQFLHFDQKQQAKARIQQSSSIVHGRHLLGYRCNSRQCVKRIVSRAMNELNVVDTCAARS
jgi:hypothetical protein